MRQTVYKRSHSSNGALFYLRQIKSMLKYGTVPKYYDLRCRWIFSKIHLFHLLLYGGTDYFR